MTDKQNLINMLAETNTNFKVFGQQVIIDTSINDNKTTFIFSKDGKLIEIKSN